MQLIFSLAELFDRSGVARMIWSPLIPSSRFRSGQFGSHNCQRWGHRVSRHERRLVSARRVARIAKRGLSQPTTPPYIASWVSSQHMEAWDFAIRGSSQDTVPWGFVVRGSSQGTEAWDFAIRGSSLDVGERDCANWASSQGVGARHFAIRGSSHDEPTARAETRPFSQSRSSTRLRRDRFRKVGSTRG